MSKKILIITPSWIGDCVMTQPLYRRLHELHPGCTIDAFAPKWSMAVFERMPEISRVIENPFGHGALELKKRWRLGRELGKQGYDQVIVLPGSLKSALIAFATGIKQRTGYVGESRYLLLNDIRKLDKAALPLMVDRYTALAHPTQADFNGHSDNPRFTISPESRAAALAKYGLDTDKPVLAFCPGAEYGPAKRWPARHFAALARRQATGGLVPRAGRVALIRVVHEAPEGVEGVPHLLPVPVEAVRLDPLPALLADGGQQDRLEEPGRGDGVGPADAQGCRPLRLQGVQVGHELVEGVALARLGDPRALKNAPVEHQEVRAVSGQGGRVLGPVDRDRGQHVLGELRLDVVGEEGGDVADGAGVAPRGDVAADEALPDVGRVPARDARGEGDVGLGASAAGHRDLVHGGLGVPRLVLVDEGVEGG